MIVNVSEHSGHTEEILVRILLARDIHIVHEAVRHTRLLVVLHGDIDIGKSLLPRLALCVRPVLESQVAQSAEHAVVSRCGTSILTAEVMKELWCVQQALQHSVAVALYSRVVQALALGLLLRKRAS